MGMADVMMVVERRRPSSLFNQGCFVVELRPRRPRIGRTPHLIFNRITRPAARPRPRGFVLITPGRARDPAMAVTRDRRIVAVAARSAMDYRRVVLMLDLTDDPGPGAPS